MSASYRSVLKPFTGKVFAALDSTLRKLGYRIRRQDIPSHFEPLLHKRLAKNPRFFFVQIGANDGISSDPIREFVTTKQVEGLVVEPLKDVFEKLASNYRHYPNVKPVRTAIHRTAKSMEIHRVDPSLGAHLGNWAQGIASFRTDHHALSNTPKEVIVAETVPCMTLDELFHQHGVTTIDLLQIDTEGYDAEILRMLDFQKWKPAVIRFEHGLPDGIMSLAEFKEITGILLEQGYYLLMEEYDAVAYLPDQLG